MAGSYQDVVVLVDRGLLDGSAYVGAMQWEAVLDDLGVSAAHIRDNRYDAIIHMITAADGAEAFYGTMVNESRYESANEAKEKDDIIRQAYMGHQNWMLIKNTDCVDFDEKIEKTKNSVL